MRGFVRASHRPAVVMVVRADFQYACHGTTECKRYCEDVIRLRLNLSARPMPLKLIRRPYRHTVGANPYVCALKNERNLLLHFPSPPPRSGLRAFSLCRHESNDGTPDCLLGQSDCALYHTTESYRLTRGVNWITDLLNVHVLGDWGIFLDCDEFFVYQDMETTSFST